MQVEVLVATMNQNRADFLNKMNINGDVLVINQSNNYSKEENGQERIYSFKEKGLSKSRNKALKHAKGEVCVITDDDVIFKDNYIDIINNAYLENKEADIIVFQVENQYGELFKKYYPKKRNINFLTSMKISSVEITFKLDSIKRKEIKFNEQLGSGAEFYLGEESVFLSDCLKSGLKIKYIPIVIATVEVGNSTWFEGYNQKYFISKGAAFYAMSKTFWLLICLQFLLRKRKLYNDNLNIREALSLMRFGKNKYKSMVKDIEG